MIGAPLDATLEKPRGFERAEVLRNCRRGDGAVGGNLAHGAFAACQPFDDRPTRRVGERRESPVEAREMPGVKRQIGAPSRRA